MTILIVLLLTFAAAILVGRLLLRRIEPRLRRELRSAREAAQAVPGIRADMELLYQLHLRDATPPLPDAPEVSPFTRGAWSLIGGEGTGWSANAFYKVRGLAAHQGGIFASLTGPNPDGPNGQVWRLDGGSAIQVGGDKGNSWPAGNSFVDHVFSKDDSALLAAEKSGVWSLENGQWTPLRDGLELNDKCGPYSFATWNGKVVMGQWGAPRVAQLGDDGKWTYLPEPESGWGVGARTIYCLIEFKGALYAGTGTGKLTGPASAVWRFDGTRWEKVGGDGIRGSWARGGLPFVLSLTVFGDVLIATVSRPDDTPYGASSVWLFDGNRWGPLAVAATPALMAESLIMNDAIVYKGQLVVATGHATRHAAQIWTFDKDRSWQPIGPAELASPPVGDGGWWVYRLCTDGERLYASTAGHTGAARVYCYTPASH